MQIPASTIEGVDPLNFENRLSTNSASRIYSKCGYVTVIVPVKIYTQNLQLQFLTEDWRQIGIEKIGLQKTLNLYKRKKNAEIK